MSWQLINSWTITESEIVIPENFVSRLILSATDIAGYRPTWNWAGFFYQYLDIEPIGFVRLPEKIYLPILEPLLFTPQIFKPNYQLKFIKANWITSVQLTIYQDTTPLNSEPFGVCNLLRDLINTRFNELSAKIDAIDSGGGGGGGGSNGFSATGGGNFTPNSPTDNFGFGFTQGFF